MSAARLASAMLVFSGFALFGKVRCARLKHEADEVSCLASDISEFESLLADSGLMLPAIARRLSSKAFTGEFWKSVAYGLDNGLDPASAFEGARGLLGCGEAIGPLAELFASIGSSDAESELKRLRSARNKLEMLAEQAKKRADESIRLKGSLSLLMGLAAALILL